MIELPRPVEKARSSGNWAAKSQEFFIAGKTLAKEQLRSVEIISASNGKPIDENLAENFVKAGMFSSIVFLLAFSIELLVKAVLIEKDAAKWIPDKGRVKFQGHNISNLANEEICIKFTEDEEKILNRITDYVSWGKYPERLNPSEVEEGFKDLFGYHPYVTWSLKEFITLIESIRNKLNEEYKTNNQQDNQVDM